MDQFCECMREQQPETNPGRDGEKKEKIPQELRSREGKKLSICPPVAGDYSGREEKCRLIVMERSQRRVPEKRVDLTPAAERERMALHRT